MKKIARRQFGIGVLLLLVSFSLHAQNPISWDFKLSDAGNGEVNILATATVEQGWYMYDTNIPEGGPNPTMIEFDEIRGAVAVGDFKSVDKEAKVKFDEIFQMEIGSFTNSVTFAQRLKVTDKSAFSVIGNVRAQACNDQTCTPPLPVDFSFTGSNLPATLVITATSSDDVSGNQNEVVTGNETADINDAGSISGNESARSNVTLESVDRDLLDRKSVV